LLGKGQDLRAAAAVRKSAFDDSTDNGLPACRGGQRGGSTITLRIDGKLRKTTTWPDRPSC
jgi:hypothetical protein